MKKEIDLFKLQNIVEKPITMEGIFKCRYCNKPLLSLIDAYSCECRFNNEKKIFWPINASKNKKYRKI
jgi:hypothetical protein